MTALFGTALFGHSVFIPYHTEFISIQSIFVHPESYKFVVVVVRHHHHRATDLPPVWNFQWLAPRGFPYIYTSIYITDMPLSFFGSEGVGSHPPIRSPHLAFHFAPFLPPNNQRLDHPQGRCFLNHAHLPSPLPLPLRRSSPSSASSPPQP